MEIQRIPVGQLGANCYIVTDGRSGEALIIDPGDDSERISDYIDRHGLKPIGIFFTHAHYDHVCAAGDLKKLYNAPVIMHEDEQETYEMTKNLCISRGLTPEDFPADYKTVRGGDRIAVGSLSLEVMHTPGHSPGSVCLHGGGAVITGDTLFRGSVGRSDLPGGNTSQLFASLGKLKTLPAGTRVLSGHGDESTIEHEIRNNPYLKENFSLYIHKQ